MKYRIFVNRKKVSIELKFWSLNVFKNVPGVECRKQFRVYKTSIFFVNYSENHRIFPGGSMGKMIGRGIRSRRIKLVIVDNSDSFLRETLQTLFHCDYR